MRILIIGSGGREYAIALKLSKSQNKPELHYIGSHRNPGLENLCESYTEACGNFKFRLYLECLEETYDFAIIGPEGYLALGWANILLEYKIPVFGPTKEHARIETSKAYARTFLTDIGLNLYQPRFAIVKKTDVGLLEEILSLLNENVVIKPDGLMGGKGVKVFGDHLKSMEEVKNYALELLGTSDKIVVEEKLVGQEFSLMSLVFSESDDLIHCPLIQDFKRSLENDLGPNTGGMGCISYADGLLPGITQEDVNLARTINEQVVNGLNAENTERPYIGVLYGSYMKTERGKLKIIEFNARFGDPECICALELMEFDFAKLLYSKFEPKKKLIQDATFLQKSSVCKYVVPAGYPENPERQYSIILPSEKDLPNGVSMVYAGLHKDHPVHRMTGSRAVAFICCDDELAKAEQAVETAISMIKGHVRHRSDIGKVTSLGEAKSAYESSGVNIEEGNKTVRKIKKYVESTYTDETTSNFGDFAGMMRITGPCNLVMSTDGVGTKSDVVLDYYGKCGHKLLGMDIVNHCVNDTLVKGAFPLAFLDYYGTGRLDSEAVRYLVKGAAKACKESGCVLIGGETAEMPGTYNDNKCDIVGTIIGRVSEDAIIDGKANIAEGDAVMAFPSVSPHTNGYSLIRNVLGQHPELKNDKLFMENICKPHRCYLKEIKKIREDLNVDIHGLCHITGGGLVDNPERVLPDNLKIDWVPWKWPSIYKKIQKFGKVSNEEMIRVFNCGVGMLIIVPSESVPMLESNFFDIFNIGSVILKQ